METLKANRARFRNGSAPEIRCDDVRELDYANYEGVDLVSAGAPCQPFSQGGRLRGEDDDRNMFPEAIRAIRDTGHERSFSRMCAASCSRGSVRTSTTCVAELRVPSGRFAGPRELGGAQEGVLDAIPDEVARVSGLLEARQRRRLRTRPGAATARDRRAAASEGDWTWPVRPTTGEALLRELHADRLLGRPRGAPETSGAPFVGAFRRNRTDIGYSESVGLAGTRFATSPVSSVHRRRGAAGAPKIRSTFTFPARGSTRSTRGARWTGPRRPSRPAYTVRPAASTSSCATPGRFDISPCGSAQRFKVSLRDTSRPSCGRHAMRQLGNAVPVPLAEAIGKQTRGGASWRRLSKRTTTRPSGDRATRQGPSRSRAKSADHAAVESVDITPTPRILKVLGDIEFAPWQCIAELVDNSFDEFLSIKRSGISWKEPFEVSVQIPTEKAKGADATIVFSDNGRGMTLDQVTNAAKAGWTANDPFSNLGLFGMGFNVATARLGKVTRLLTARAGDAEWVGLEIHLDNLGEDFAAPVVRRKKCSPNEHGTRVEVAGLDKRSDWLRRSTNHKKLRDTLGGVYAYLLDREGFRLSVNDVEVEPVRHCVWSNERSVTRRKETIPAVIEIDKSLPDRAVCHTCWTWQPVDNKTCDECGGKNSRCGSARSGVGSASSGISTTKSSESTSYATAERSSASTRACSSGTIPTIRAPKAMSSIRSSFRRTRVGSSARFTSTTCR